MENRILWILIELPIAASRCRFQLLYLLLVLAVSNCPMASNRQCHPHRCNCAMICNPVEFVLLHVASVAIVAEIYAKFQLKKKKMKNKKKK